MTVKTTTSNKTAIVLTIILHYVKLSIIWSNREAYEHFAFPELRYVIFLTTGGQDKIQEFILNNINFYEKFECYVQHYLIFNNFISSWRQREYYTTIPRKGGE